MVSGWWDRPVPVMVGSNTTRNLTGQLAPLDRSRGQALDRVVQHYRPEWAGVPYFDELPLFFTMQPANYVKMSDRPSTLWREPNIASLTSYPLHKASQQE